MNNLLNIEALIKELTIEEKAALLSGTNFMYTNAVPRLDIPSICMADGPHGVRKQIGMGDNGISMSEPATAFPTAATTASGWNPDNLRRMGEAMGEECLSYGVNINLGPAVNIKKNPRCGRNFEYFSEDPYLTGIMGTALAKGIQNKGVGVSVKHFAANNAEDNRFMGDSIIDERALREIYLRGFERIVKEAKPDTMMCAYNRINGEFCSENKWLLNEVLRAEWGFDGVVMTDWGAVKDRVKGVSAGLDLEMPGDTAYCRKNIIEAAKNGSLDKKDLDEAVRNILKLVNKCLQQKKIESFNKQAHNELAVEIAADSAALLKNDGSLPLRKKEKLLIVGELFEKMRYQGAGSSMINSTFITTPKDAFDKAGIIYEYAKGYLENSFKPSKKLQGEACIAASKHEKVIVFAGLTDYAESEGCDRPDLKLPQNQVALIEKLIAAGKKIILVLFGGSSVELPFLKSINAVLNMFLPGQGGGEACKKLLFGEINPSGKLSETWVKTYADVPFGDEYSKTIREIYKESIYIGYRYYDHARKEVLFPFGYGLSYTNFEYANITVRENSGTVVVSCDIKNVGSVDGGEVVQLYVKNNNSRVFKADKELRAFTKVYLKSGETIKAEMCFEKSELSYYNVKEKTWILENGTYEIQVGASSADIKLKQELKITGEKEVDAPYDTEVLETYNNFNPAQLSQTVFEKLLNQKILDLPPVKPFHIETKFIDFKKSFMGRIIYKSVLKIATKQMKKAKKMPAGAERDNSIKGAVFLKRILESNCIRSFSMCGGAQLPYNVAEGMVEIGNGHLKKGMRKMKEVIEVPPLPRDVK